MASKIGWRRDSNARGELKSALAEATSQRPTHDEYNIYTVKGAGGARENESDVISTSRTTRSSSRERERKKVYGHCCDRLCMTKEREELLFFRGGRRWRTFFHLSITFSKFY